MDFDDQAIHVNYRYPDLGRRRKSLTIPFTAVTDISVDLTASTMRPGLPSRVRPKGYMTRRAIVGGFIPSSGTPWMVFYAVRRGMPAVVIDYHSNECQRAIVEAAEPDRLAAQLQEALSRSRSAIDRGA